jgi:hypothetical protein
MKVEMPRRKRRQLLVLSNQMKRRPKSIKMLRSRKMLMLMLTPKFQLQMMMTPP